MLAIDTKTNDSLDVEISNLANRFDFFLPWAGMEKAQLQMENPADIKAADKMAKLYDEILKDNPHKEKEDIHRLNVFLSRLLFCFFAEDTGIFAESILTNSIKSHTQEDGSDLNSYLERLFEVLNTKDNSGCPDYLQQFPYVNGGLFKEKYNAPKFSRRSRKLVIECGELQWREINPDIFGSMIQAVIDPDKRGGLGMHYTSVPNIMKVIEPLFLNELYEELENNLDNLNKLEKLLQRIAKIKIFDPACGSGNFLIIAYKELRTLEMKIVKRVQELQEIEELKKQKRYTQKSLIYSKITLSQFYGIEIDDFASEIATLSLWLAEHQMNMKYKETFGISKPSLPLQESGKIVCGNATRLDWEEVCPKNPQQMTVSEMSNLTISEVSSIKVSQLQGEQDEIYILGNPPYLGFKSQDEKQKEDMAALFKDQADYKSMDYISCWFFKAALYIQKNERAAFVSTNSICQGTHVEMLWSKLRKFELEIGFAVRAFKWSNHAKRNAGVTCIVIGLRQISKQQKFIIDNNHFIKAKNINAYLVDTDDIIIKKRREGLNGLPKISDGSGALDGGYLILSNEEKVGIEKAFPEAKAFIRPYLGSNEYINGVIRWCIWIEDNDLDKAKKIDPIKEKINEVYKFRENAGTRAKTALNRPHKFAWINTPEISQIIIPTVSSERRSYIPIGFLDAQTIVSNSASIVHNPEPYVFGFITSKMHMTWVRAVAGRLEERIRYTSAICYNTFPMPELTQKQKETITQHVSNVLGERENHSEKTMAELYDPDKMPDGLRQAHKDLDIAVEQCYRSKPFTGDDERLEYLFNLYEKMTNTEKQGEQKCLPK